MPKKPGSSAAEGRVPGLQNGLKCGIETSACLCLLVALCLLPTRVEGKTVAPAGAVTPSVADSSLGHDSTKTRSDSVSAGVRIYDYIAYPTLQALTWPIETLLVPVTQILIYPSKEPIRYFLNENVIDRMHDLISFGSRDQMMIYPTLDLAPGTTSRTGLTFRDLSLFGRSTDQLALYTLLYVNGDTRIRTYVTADSLAGTPMQGKIAFGLTHMKNASFDQPGTNTFFYYSDTSEHYQFQLQYPLAFGFKAQGIFFLDHYRFGQAPPNSYGFDGDFFLNPATGKLDSTYRGLNQTFWDRVYSIGLVRDTRNNENITLAGSNLSVNWNYHDVGLGHAFHDWTGEYAKYFKLGSERYEITSEEEKKMGPMSLKRMLQQLESRKLRTEIFSRKVVAFHLYAAQSFEIPGQSMPFYGLQTLGNDTPLRGYQGSRFRNYAVAAASGEYRFPVLRLMDGTLFDEYGVSGRSWSDIDYLNFKNSWGFGIRVRRPDIFLFRAQVGIHGVSGMVFNMSVDAPY